MKKRSNTSTRTSGIWSRRSWENRTIERTNMFKPSYSKAVLTLGVTAAFAASLCPQAGIAAEKRVEIRVKGSDTLVQLATAWAEAYRKVNKNVFVNVNGGGTGTGVAALQNNSTDICNASREIKKEESEKVKSVSGK